jgi:hypothetical protein
LNQGCEFGIELWENSLNFVYSAIVVVDNHAKPVK